MPSLQLFCFQGVLPHDIHCEPSSPAKREMRPLSVNDFHTDLTSRWPQILREKVQDYLTLGWINKLPLLQSTSPAALVVQVLSTVLGRRISDYVYVDFASGAGGPTPYIEKQLNGQLHEEGKEDVKFVLSDISPHIGAWEAAAKKSENLSYIKQSVDATNAPTAETLLQDVPGVQGKKVMRLFSLAFHHFDDDLAAKVLENTIETSDGFWSAAHPRKVLFRLTEIASSSSNHDISAPSSLSACCGPSP